MNCDPVVFFNNCNARTKLKAEAVWLIINMSFNYTQFSIILHDF